MKYVRTTLTLSVLLCLAPLPLRATALARQPGHALAADGEDCAHTYSHGICTQCGQPQPDYVKPATDGYYNLSDGYELLWWSRAVAAQSPSASARLTADIDMRDIAMTPIGNSEDKAFQGTFDGQGHTISNLAIQGEERVGLFRYVTGGVYVKNFVLDASCSISGTSYCGTIGCTVGNGSINVECIGMEGSVTASGVNAGGIVGCCFGGALLISDCYATGKVTGSSESAAIAGWTGGAAILTNVWACADVEGVQGDAWLYRGGIERVANCYAMSGNQGTIVTEEQLAGGALTCLLNGGVVDNPVWRQTLDSDTHPVLGKGHGIVFRMAGDDYRSITTAQDIPAVASAVDQSVSDYCDGAMAEQALLDTYRAHAQALAGCADVAAFCEAYTLMQADRQAAEASAAVYARYVARCAEMGKYLDDNPQLEGPGIESLRDYLQSDAEASDAWPLGGYLHVTEGHTATAAQVEAELERLEQAYAAALAGSYAVGQDITSLMANADLSQEPAWSGWEGTCGSGLGTWQASDGKSYTAGESWQHVTDMHQTLTGLRPGYYLVGMNGAYRHNNDRYSHTYSAQFYAGDYNVYLPTVYETRISADEAQDDVNCNISGEGTIDLPIYENGGTTSDEAPIAYALHGVPGMAYAIASGRAQNWLAAYVGQDGQLTFGARLPDNGAGGNWMGFGNFRLTYCGDATTSETTDALARALDGQTSRARALLTLYQPDAVTPEAAPNYPSALKEALGQAVDEAVAATSTEEKMRCMSRYSDLFDQINEARTAYLSLYHNAALLESAGTILKDSLTQAQYDEILSASEALYRAYTDGTCSAAEAAAPALMQSEVIRQYIPEIDANGVIHIASARNMMFFSAYVNDIDHAATGRLEADIHGVTAGMTLKDFRGTLDGAYHTMTLDITHPAENAGLVEVLGGTVKNLYLEGTVSTEGKYAGSVAGTTGNASAYITNVVSRVHIISTVEGDGTHGGLVGCANTGVTLTGCAFAGAISGDKTNCCGGLVGWLNAAATIDGCLQVADLSVDASGGHTWARNPGNMTLTNSCYLRPYGTEAGTLVTEAQLTSGEACYMLNGESNSNPTWYQTLGEDPMPVPDPSHRAVGITYEGTYTNDASRFAVEHTGTQGDPYVLATVADLERMRGKMRLGEVTYFVLNNDIDMASIDSWTPINGVNNDYNGRNWQRWIDLDGKGHVLRNLKVSGHDYGSFFGVLCGNVRNIGFEDVDVECTTTGCGVLGGYVGHTHYADADGNMYTCQVENVWVTGRLRVSSAYCGGFFGNVGGPTVMRNCYAQVEITSGASLTGGLIGRVRDALTMENCYAAGSIQSGTWGGIVGGGQKGSTPATTYHNIVVWNNTEQNFGGTASGDKMSGILYYDGTNFGDLQQAVVAWDSDLWSCTMQEGAYPVLLKTAIGVRGVDADATPAAPRRGIYTLTGVRVDKPVKGLYIIDGRKVMVK